MKTHKKNLAFLVITTTLLFGSGCMEEKEKQSSLKLSITSTPEKAAVSIDGKKKGKTPLQVNLPAGEHMVEITLTGYRTEWSKIPANQTGSFAINKTLQKKTAPVIIETTPDSALCTLNGIDKGETPLTIAELPVGHYTAIFKKAGYADKTIEFTVDDPRPLRIEEELETITAILEVWTDPPGSGIFLNGNFYGSTSEDGLTPLVVNDLPAGEYDVVVRKEQYRELSQTVILERKQRKVLRFPPLELLPGGIEIITKPNDARIYDENEKLLGGAPYRDDNLPPGSRTYIIRKQGFEDQKETVVITPGVSKRLEIILGKFTGTLILSTQPPECSIMIDGKNVGTTNPSNIRDVSEVFRFDELTPGPHLVRVVHPQFKPFQQHFLVKKGKTTDLGSIKLAKKWFATHTLTLKNGRQYEGVLKFQNEDGSIEFENANGVISGYKSDEIEAVKPIMESE